MKYESVAALRILDQTGLPGGVLHSFEKGFRSVEAQTVAVQTVKKWGFSAEGLDLVGRVLTLEKDKSVKEVHIQCGPLLQGSPLWYHVNGHLIFVAIDVFLKNGAANTKEFPAYLNEHQIPHSKILRHEGPCYELPPKKGRPATIEFYAPQ